MITDTQGLNWRIQFDDLPDMVRYAEVTPRVWRQRSSEADRGGNSWDLGAGLHGALRMARDGWQEGIRKIAALAAVVPPARLTVRSYDVAGEFADVPRAIVGDPFNMVRRGKAKVAKPSITIVVDCGVSGATPSSAIANYGAALTALVDRLEAHHVRVELIGAFAGAMAKGRLGVAWHIKHAEDHLDLNAVAFGIAHPAMFRRIGFTIFERSPAHMESPGYGSCTEVRAADLIDCPPDALIIPGLNAGSGHGCNDMTTALDFAKGQINRAAVKLFGEPLAALELEAA